MEEKAEKGQQEQQTSTTTTENNETSDIGEKKTENKQPDVDIDAKIAEALTKAQKNFEDTLKKPKLKTVAKNSNSKRKNFNAKNL